MALQLVLSLALNQFSSNMGIVFSLLSELSTKLISTQKSFEKLDLELGRLSFRFQQHGQLLNDSKIFDNLKKLREHSIYTAEEIGKAYEAAFSVNNQDPERIVRIAKDVSAYLGTKPEEFVKNLRNLSVNSGVDELRQVGIKGATFLDFQKSGYTTQSQLIELVLNKLDKSVKGADESLYNRIKGRIEITNSYSDNLFKVGEVVNGILNKIYPKITSILDTLGTNVSNYLSNIDFNELFKQLESIWDYIKDNIIPIFKELYNVFIEIFNTYKDILSPIITFLKEHKEILGQIVKLWIEFNLSYKGVNLITSSVIALGTAFSNPISAIAILIAGIVTLVTIGKQTVDDLSNRFKSSSFTLNIKQLGEKFNENEQSIKDLFNKNRNELQEDVEFDEASLPELNGIEEFETNPILKSFLKKVIDKYGEKGDKQNYIPSYVFKLLQLFNLSKSIADEIDLKNIFSPNTQNTTTKEKNNKEFKGKVPPGQSNQLLSFEKSQKVNYVNITIENLNGIQNGELKIVKGDEGQTVRYITENVSQALQYVVASTFADNSNLRQNV